MSDRSRAPHWTFFRFSPDRDTFVSLIAWAAVVAINVIAWLIHTAAWRVFWYFGVEALLACIVFPSWYWARYRRRSLAEIGLTLERLGPAILVGIVIAAATVAPRLHTVFIPSTVPLLWLTICLTYSAVFEEIFFRGFLQTRFEAAFGMLPAIVLSGLTFSLYHVGYEPYWRHAQVLLLMVAVGIIFAIAFRITSNVITSIIVNVPNAIVAFLARGRLFDATEAAISLLTIVTVLTWLSWVSRP